MPEYLVSTVARSVNGHDVSSEVTRVEDGVEIEVDGSDIVVHARVQADDARAALNAGRQISSDVLVALGANYAGYRIQPHDPRDLVSRAETVYQSDGPLPLADVAEGYLTLKGAELLDPTGEIRRAGKVLRFRAEGQVTTRIDDGLRSLACRAQWSPRLRLALVLYWEGQCSDSPDTRYVLSMAALEVLTPPPQETLLHARLDKQQRRSLMEKISEACAKAELGEADVVRLTDRFAGTRRIGAVDSGLDYLTASAPDGFGPAGPAKAEEVKAWQGMRGRYLHSGVMDPDSQPNRDRLVAIVGVCLRTEMERYQ